jgi:peptide/nickel transport system substrate-binding protein
MDQKNYWQRLREARLSRRRALVGAGAVSVGAMALGTVGCGGGGSGTGGTAATGSSLLSPSEPSTDQAKAGGLYKSLTGADVTSFDPLSSQSFTTQVASGYVYSRLLKITPGVGKPSTGDVEGDLAESWEVSDDKLQITLHLRKNLKWDSRPPTNNRAVTADDVVFSWDKFASLSPYAGVLANSKSKDAAVLSLTAADQNTVVVKLAFPDAAALTMLGSSAALYIMPSESDGQFDPRGETRGSGPWVLETYRPSGGFTYAKNLNWYRSDLPFLDKIDYPIVPEYASQLSQFRAGNVYGGVGVHAEDILPLKRDLPQLIMRQGSFNRLWFNSWFGYQGTNVFKDERVRQAWSMSYDRDLWIETIYATQEFTNAGLVVDTRWHSHFPSGLEGWWVDPQDDKAFGDNAKYFKFDQAQAKQLLSAAGMTEPTVTATFIASLQYGTTFQNQVQIQTGFANDIGFKTRLNNPDYQTEWLSNYYYGKGNFEGIALGADNPELDPGVFMFLRFHPSGGRFKGFSPSGIDPSQGDPQVTDMVNRIRQEFDVGKRKDIAKEFQQYMAKAMYAVPFPGQAAPFALSWPALGNANVYNVGGEGYGGGTETLPYLWLDQTKPPIAG